MNGARPADQARTGDGRARRRALLAALACSLGLGACAVVEAPPGGPPDVTAPRLARVSPDSGSTSTGEVRTLRLDFTEKMTRAPAEGWLYFYPKQRIRRTSWHGAQQAEVELFEPLPADTVVVVEVATTMQDAHKVKSRESRRFPLSTGAPIPGGLLTGVLVMGDSALTSGVVELFPLAPDTLAYFQRPLLRRAVTDHTGRWTFPWLPVPGGPWLVRAFADGDANLRPGEREAQRLLPDTLSLTVERPELRTGTITLYAPGTPGRLRVAPFDRRGWTGSWFAWAMAVSEGDTGWTPAPGKPAAGGAKASALDPEAGTTLDKVPSGAVRVVIFADVDGDSLLGGVARDQLRALATAAPWPDTLSAAKYLEPWWVVEGLQVPPGLAADLVVPVTPATLTPWTAADSTAVPGAPGAGAPKPKESR